MRTTSQRSKVGLQIEETESIKLDALAPFQRSWSMRNGLEWTRKRRRCANVAARVQLCSDAALRRTFFGLLEKG